MSRIKMDMRHISVSALNALRAGKLSAQHPDNTECLYRSEDGSVCAIGAGITDEQIAIIEADRVKNGITEVHAWNTHHVGQLAYDYFDVEKSEDQRCLDKLQSLHDEVQRAKMRGDATDAIKWMNKLTALINGMVGIYAPEALAA